MRPLLFLKTGFMERYQGTKGDKVFSEMRWVQEHGTAHERLNFKPRHGRCFGYAPLAGIDIQKHFGADADAEFIDGVDVVWAALRPKPLGGLVIVGWYRNARVFRTKRPPPSLIIAQAKAEDCKCLPVDERLYRLPTTGEGAFRSPIVWYAEQYPQIIRDARAMIDGTYKQPKGKIVQPRKTDPDITHRQEVENNAIAAVITKYEQELNFSVRDVQAENCGWDLEATRREQTWFIEVKGTAHKAISPLLTPNEYKMALEHKANYRICIVTDALVSPVITDLFYVAAIKAWITSSGEKWEILEVKSGTVKRVS